METLVDAGASLVEGDFAGAALALAGEVVPGGKGKGKSSPGGPTQKEISTQCFAAGTPIAMSGGESPIETIELGQRVLTSPDGEQISETIVDPETWNQFELRMANPDCSDDFYQIKLLRPQVWESTCERNDKGQIWFEMEEMGLAGWADIVSITECPSIEDGQGRVVLMTINHDNTFLYSLTTSQRGPPLIVTGYHPLFSADRNNWIQVLQLKEGEKLRTRSGTETIKELKRSVGRVKVYNIEVEVDHRYYAGEDGILAHNAGCKKRNVTKVSSTRKKSKDARPKPKPMKPGKKRVTRQTKNKKGEGNKRKTDGGTQTEHFHDGNHDSKTKDNVHYRTTKKVKAKKSSSTSS